jgi:ATP-dependent Clp protease ATP-binding subunit ClpC
MTNHAADIAHWSEMLEEHRENLRLLRKQKVNFGIGDERLDLLKKITAAEDGIREAKAKLRKLGEEPRASAIDPPEKFNPFDSKILKTYPQPIAQACANFNQEHELGRRFVALDRVIVHLIKYLAAIFIGQARRDKPPDYPLPDSLNWIDAPTIECWTDAIEKISHVYEEPEWRAKWQLTDLLAACTQPLLDRSELVEAIDYLTLQSGRSGIDEPSVIDFLQLLAWYCSQQWESGAGLYPFDQIEPLLARLQPALAVVLNELDSLRRYPLVYVEWAEVVDSEVHLRPVKFMGLFTEDVAPHPKPPLVVPQSDALPIKPKRFYVASDGIPQVSLHPFFVNYRWELYQLERHEPTAFIEFRSCSRGTKFRPPPEARTYFTSWSEGELQEIPVEEEPPVLGESDEWYKDVDIIPSDAIADPIPLTWLNPEGRQALEIALGEALRIGRFWLGLEFLLMALSKQRGCAFLALLREVGIHPGEFRGLLRGVVGVVTEGDWRRQDVATLGAKALTQVRRADPDLVRWSFKEKGEPPPVITPRLMTILEDAVKLAGEGQVGHNHLLGAILRHHRSLAMQLFFSQAYEAGWSPEQMITRLSELVDKKPEDLLEGTPEPREGLPPRGDWSGARVRPPRSPRGSILAEYGRDLTQAAHEGKLHPAEGETARRAMAQIGRILLQKEANNPILIGDSGVGKTAIVEGFAWRLAGRGKKVVKQLTGRRVVELSANTLMAGTKYRGDLEERLQQLLGEVKAADGQIIVFIDEIHSILGGGASGGLSAIADAIKPALARGEFPCIGATTVAEYRQHIEKDAALARRFTPIWLEEPSLEEALQIVEKVAIGARDEGEEGKGRLAKHHGVKFAKEAIEAAVRLSARYIHDERLPGKAIKVLDQASSSLIIPGSLSGEPDDERSIVGGVVTKDAVLEVIADRTNIPLEQLGKTDKQRMLELESRLKKRVIGQDEAISQVARVVKRAGAGLTDPRRPLGVFLLAGPTGVGKTELALALAEALFDREEAIFRLDMSEFMEKHQVARLIGAPPGYVGYEAEGQLTGHLRRRPYSVVLLDEMEKAHPDVQHLFLQLFDIGRLTDAQGRLADGRHAIFIMTTNLGAKEALGFVENRKPYQEKLQAAIDEHFSLEFLNRIDRVIYFAPLDEDALVTIFDREFAPFQDRLHADKGVEVTVSPQAKRQIVQQVAKQLLGARPLRRFIEDQIVAPLVDKLLTGEVPPGTKLTIGLEQLGFDSHQSSPPVDLGKLDLSGLGPPALPASEPKRPASPKEGLPHLDKVDDEHQAAFDERFLDLARRLQEEKGIALEVTDFAKNFLCAPYNQSLRGELSPEQAFEEFIENRLTDKILEDEFQDGDWIRVDRKFEEIVFEKVEGGEG